MDGVLFDSENLDRKCWQKCLSDYGITDADTVFGKCIGRPLDEAIAILDAEFGAVCPGFDGRTFRGKTMELFDEYVEKNGMPLKYFAAECPAGLKKAGFRVGLASSTSIGRVVPQLEQTGLLRYFDDIVGGGMFKKGKPDPEIFLLSCERLEGIPSETIVIEDSHNGIRAAHAAGMKPVMVPDVVAPDDEMREKAWKIMPDLEKVLFELTK